MRLTSLLVRTANARYQESRASSDSIGVYGLRTADYGLRKSLEAPGSPILIVYRGPRARSVEINQAVHRPHQ
jgi:hypothetical protein